MIGVAAVLLLVALGLLAGGLAQGSAALQWGSFAASALAALALAVGELRQRRARADGAASAEGAAGQQVDEVAAPDEPRPRAEVGARSIAAAGTAPGAVAGAARPAGQGAAQLPAVAESTPAAEEAWVDEPPAPEPAGVVEPVPPALAPAGNDPAVLPVGDGPATGAHAVPEFPAPATGTPVLPAPAAGSHSADVVTPTGARAAADTGSEPPVEEVEVSDLLLVLDLTDEVLVIDERPRYHLTGCPHLTGVDPFPMPMDEARTDGFTPCGTCSPDRELAQRERARRSG